MKIPARLQPLVEDGLVDDVVRQLMSGKEATVYVVRCGDDVRCAKVYKEANQRSFRQSVDYTEGRKTKNSRQARAMEKDLTILHSRRKMPVSAIRSCCEKWCVCCAPGLFMATYQSLISCFLVTAL